LKVSTLFNKNSHSTIEYNGIESISIHFTRWEIFGTRVFFFLFLEIDPFQVKKKEKKKRFKKNRGYFRFDRRNMSVDNIETGTGIRK